MDNERFKADIPNYANIPYELKITNQWVVWGVKNAPSKCPFNPYKLIQGAFEPAKAGNCETWGSFRSAKKCVIYGFAQGIGYEFCGGNLYGVDLDNVLDDGGNLSPQVQEIVNLLDSYTEISPSGKGLHVLLKAEDVSIARHRKMNCCIEIYNNIRYFTVTGYVYGKIKSIETRSKQLQEIHDSLLLPDNKQKTVCFTPVSGLYSKEFLDVGLEKDNVLRECWNGNRRFEDESGSDLAFMNKLAYWCNGDVNLMIKAFFHSPYFAQKDDFHKRKCLRVDYLLNTAKVACASLCSTAQADRERWMQGHSVASDVGCKFA